MNSRAGFGLAIAVAMGACDPVATTTTPTTTPSPAPQPEQPDADPAIELAGAVWMSPECGERTYARTLELAADGTFVVRDLVSPCPEGATCVWSGIVERRGTYTATNDGIALVLADDTKGPGAKPLPTTLGRDATGAPTERGAGGVTCFYGRG